jgi:uncharacterized protein YjlB
MPQLKIERGIQAARTIFGKCYFDAEKCADGIQSVRHYRCELDEKLGSLRKGAAARLGIARGGSVPHCAGDLTRAGAGAEEGATNA